MSDILLARGSPGEPTTLLPLLRFSLPYLVLANLEVQRLTCAGMQNKRLYHTIEDNTKRSNIHLVSEFHVQSPQRWKAMAERILFRR